MGKNNVETHFYLAQTIREADRWGMECLGVSGMVLMENAGAGAAREIGRLYPRATRVGILGGPGNNGGDGFVVARHLALRGHQVTVYITQSPEKYRGDSGNNLRIILEKPFKEKIRLKETPAFTEEELTYQLGENQELLVDALLGTGTQGAPRKEVLRVLESLEKSSIPLVSLDVPSGIHPDTGALLGPPVKAQYTLTFLAPKRGLVILPGADHAGRIITVPIGIPLPPGSVPSGELWTGEKTARLLPRRGASTHKGSRGGVLILGGSSTYWGAPILAGLGAFKSGAGLVVLGIPQALGTPAAIRLPEAIQEPLAGNHMTVEEVRRAMETWGEKCGSLVLGPGMGKDPESLEAVRAVWTEWGGTLVVDGDGLGALGTLEKELPFRANTILTPHEQEAARLLKKPLEGVLQDRVGAAEELSQKWGVVLLKGATTVIGEKGYYRIVSSGSPALGVAGSGDLLSGIIGGLTASQKKEIYPSKADLALLAASGAWIHGSAGSLTESKTGTDGALVSEIAKEIPRVIQKLRKNRTKKEGV